MSGRNEKGSTPLGAIFLLKRGVAAYLVARAGWSSRFSPSSATSLHSPMRRGRLAGRGGPLHPSCRRNACRYRDRHERRTSCTAPSRPCTPEPCRTYRRNRGVAAGDALLGKGRQRLAACCCRRLFLARWIRLPRRHMGSRRRVRPDRRRYPRGLRGAAEAQEPCEEIGAMLLKHRQDGFGGESKLYMHGVMHSLPYLDGRFR